MQLDGVVFYGRHGEHALQMFGLEQELQRWQGARVLDCPGGPGSLTRQRTLSVAEPEPAR